MKTVNQQFNEIFKPSPLQQSHDALNKKLEDTRQELYKMTRLNAELERNNRILTRQLNDVRDAL